MSKNGYKHKNYLENKFDDRVNFNRTERKLYGHDIATVPSLVKPFIGNTLPDAVVQPQSEQELSELSVWAAKTGCPLHQGAKLHQVMEASCRLNRG